MCSLSFENGNVPVWFVLKQCISKNGLIRKLTTAQLSNECFIHLYKGKVSL